MVSALRLRRSESVNSHYYRDDKQVCRDSPLDISCITRTILKLLAGWKSAVYLSVNEHFPDKADAEIALLDSLFCFISGWYLGGRCRADDFRHPLAMQCLLSQASLPRHNYKASCLRQCSTSVYHTLCLLVSVADYSPVASAVETLYSSAQLLCRRI